MAIASECEVWWSVEKSLLHKNPIWKIGVLICSDNRISSPRPDLDTKGIRSVIVTVLSSLGVEFYGMCSTVLFPSLRTLTIKCMAKLEEWKDAPEEVTSARVVFPCLEELTIEECPQLRSAPCHFPFLQKLKIRGGVYNNTALERISSNLTALQSLIIRDCGKLSYIPDTSQPLISLEELLIYDCRELMCIPRIQGLRLLFISWCGIEDLTTQLQLCTSLSKLHISECPNLKSLPDLQEFLSLAQIYISGCPNLKSLPDLQEVQSLAQLVIYECPNLKSIPDLGELRFLTRLAISDCSNITRLPEGSFKCLKSLNIGGYCEELDVFPSLNNLIQHSHTTPEYLILIGWAKLNSLPSEIQHFTALETLIIIHFDGSRAEWLKIAHIPKISIDLTRISR